MIRTLAAAAVAALAVAGIAAAHSSTAPTLSGKVGPGFTITLTKGGQKVTKLKAGSYTFVVADKSAVHNFVLEKEHGGTFERAITSVSFTGTKRLVVKLTRGTWKFYCAPHEAGMFGKFTVS